METIDSANPAALPDAFERTLNRDHYPMPSADNDPEQMARAYQARAHWWADLAAAYLPAVEDAETEAAWRPLMSAARLALSRSKHWSCAAELEATLAN